MVLLKQKKKIPAARDVNQNLIPGCIEVFLLNIFFSGSRCEDIPVITANEKFMSGFNQTTNDNSN
jgi:hypothetical protein